MQIYIKYPQPPKKKLFGQKKEQNNVILNIMHKIKHNSMYLKKYFQDINLRD